MAGEQLQVARLTSSGIDGDRIVQVRRGRGRIATARTWPDLLGFHATLGPAGEPLVDGKAGNDPSVFTAVQVLVGAAAQLGHDEEMDRYAILPLLVVTDGAIAAFGLDGRRLRPNIVIGGVPGLE